MSTKTLYYCDKCGSEIPTSGGKTAVDIKLNPYDTYRSLNSKWTSVSKYIELCVPCVEKLGFIEKTVVENKAVVTLTTADKLYDIVAQMIEEAR